MSSRSKPSNKEQKPVVVEKKKKPSRDQIIKKHVKHEFETLNQGMELLENLSKLVQHKKIEVAAEGKSTANVEIRVGRLPAMSEALLAKHKRNLVKIARENIVTGYTKEVKANRPPGANNLLTFKSIGKPVYVFPSVMDFVDSLAEQVSGVSAGNFFDRIYEALRAEPDSASRTVQQAIAFKALLGKLFKLDMSLYSDVSIKKDGKKKAEVKTLIPLDADESKASLPLILDFLNSETAVVVDGARTYMDIILAANEEGKNLYTVDDYKYATTKAIIEAIMKGGSTTANYSKDQGLGVEDIIEDPANHGDLLRSLAISNLITKTLAENDGEYVDITDSKLNTHIENLEQKRADSLAENRRRKAASDKAKLGKKKSVKKERDE